MHRLSLPESGRARRWNVGSGMGSIAFHALIALSLTLLTQGHRIALPDKPEEHPVMFREILPAPPPQSTSAAVVTAASEAVSVAAEALKALAAPLSIPDVIPEVSLSAVTPSTPGEWPRTTGHGLGQDGAGSGTASPLRPDGAYEAASMERPPVVALTAVPRYPDMLRASGVEGTVMAEFVIDTLGRAEMDSFVAASSGHALFSEAARSAVSRMRFLPGEVAGRKVRSLVRMPFRFELAKQE